MRYLFSKCEDQEDGTMVIPAWAVWRWQRQVETAYVDLPENEKLSDQGEADEILELTATVELYEALEAVEWYEVVRDDDVFGECTYCGAIAEHWSDEKRNFVGEHEEGCKVDAALTKARGKSEQD
jgi:hypothetical protein